MSGKSAQFNSILRKLSSTDTEKIFAGNFHTTTLDKTPGDVAVHCHLMGLNDS